MHQWAGIYIGKIVMNNQVKFKSKSKSMDYIDKWRFRPWVAYLNTSTM